ncbi:MAG: hypothetical protein PHE55_19040 [Methylococcaceae bacterium]|nr:hypothetical protein [Methylococcaceae bacterium]
MVGRTHIRTLDDLLNEYDLHLLALREAMARCPRPLAAGHFATRNPDLVAALGQFAYRFAKLQDAMCAKLFTSILELTKEQGYYPIFLDKLNRLEKIRAITSL